MPSFYWIKLYDEILDDPKMGRLSDGAFRFCVNLFLLAGRQDERDGRLPAFGDIAWLLRLSDADLRAHWEELEKAGIVCMADGVPFVTKFDSRQSALSDAERMRLYRERKRQGKFQENDNVTPERQESNGGVTNRNADIDIDIDKDNTPLPPKGEMGGVFNDPEGNQVFSFEDESEPAEDDEIRRSWEETLSLIALFEKLTGKKSDPFQRNGRYKTSFMDYWVTPLVNMQKVGNGHTAVAIERGIKEMDDKKLTVATPRSIEPTVLGILRRGELEKASSRKTAAPSPTPSTGEYGGII